MLRIRVPDIQYVTGLLEHLRSCGCIAYTEGDGLVRAILPDVPWREEEAQIRAALAKWESAHDVELHVERMT